MSPKFIIVVRVDERGSIINIEEVNVAIVWGGRAGREIRTIRHIRTDGRGNVLRHDQTGGTSLTLRNDTWREGRTWWQGGTGWTFTDGRWRAGWAFGNSIDRERGAWHAVSHRRTCRALGNVANGERWAR